MHSVSAGAGVLTHATARPGNSNYRWEANRERLRYRAAHLRAGVSAAIKRCTDLTISVAGILLFSPLLIVAAMRKAGLRLQPEVRMGRYAREFHQWQFTGKTGSFWTHQFVQSIPALLNVLRGEMSLVGPRALPPDVHPDGAWGARRLDVRPGLVCSWWLRCRAQINFDGERQADEEYIESATLLGDLLIALRAVPMLMFGGGRETAVADKVSLLGLEIDCLDMDETLNWMLQRMDCRQPANVAFLNAHCANLACTDPGYREALNTANLMLADGIGLQVAAKLQGTMIKQNVNGTDLFPRLCGALAGTPHSLYLLGAKPGVAAAVAAWVREKYPRTLLAGARDGYFSADEQPAVLEEIRRSGAAVLLVAMGVPRQDCWIHQHASDSGATLAIGVGGLFDFYSGRIPRAPVWMREIGMEWAYRLYQEPGRMWQRYLLGNWMFLGRVLLHRYHLYNPNPNPKRGVC